MNKTDFRYTKISEAMNAGEPKKCIQHKLAIGLMALGLALSFSTPLQADTFTVINTNDSGPGSLLEAVDLANANPGKDTINLASISGDINLASTVNFQGGIDIIGPGRDSLTLNFNMAGYSPRGIVIGDINEESSITGLSINGASVLNIGGMYQDFAEHLMLKDISATEIGGRSSSISIEDSVVQSGLDMSGGTISAKNTTISNGGLWGGSEAMSISNYVGSSISCENCVIESGGISIDEFSSLVLLNSTVTSSWTLIDGGLTIQDSSAIGTPIVLSAGFRGGGLQPVSIINSVISNSGSSFPAISSMKPFSFVNSTISNSDSAGIYLYAFGSVELVNSTIIGNKGGIVSTVDYSSAAPVQISNSIIYGNAINGHFDLESDLKAFNISHSLIGNTGTAQINDVVPGSNLIGVDPLLAPLADNGGPTQTHALLPGSPAIDAGDDTSCAATDQRGVTRPQGTACDMGAYEEDSAPPAPINVLLDSASGNTTNTGMLVYDNLYQFHRFEVTEPTRLSSVGGVFGNLLGSSVNVFAAIVELTGSYDNPDSFDLTSPDVVYTTLLAIDPGEGLYTTNVSNTLAPGWYALVFGTGAFGATSVANTSRLTMSLLENDSIPFQHVVSIRQAGDPLGESFSAHNGVLRFYVTKSLSNICDLPPVSVGGNCANEVVARSIADIDAYVASNFGRHTLANGKKAYKNLRLLGQFGQTGMPFKATSPCAITVNANASITGSDVTLHARQGLSVNWSADIDATGEACLIADKQHALLNGGNKVNANALAIRGGKKAIVGFQADLNINGAAEILSTGTSGNSNAKIGNKTTVTAERFTMKADNIAELAFKATVSTTGELSITSGTHPTSEVRLTNRSSVQAGTDLILNSQGKTSIGFHTAVTAGNNLDVNAGTEADCSIASITSVSYSSKSGNCADKLP